MELADTTLFQDAHFKVHQFFIKHFYLHSLPLHAVRFTVWPTSQWCEDENCDGSCGSDHSNEVSSDAEEADPNGDQGMAEPLNEEDWDEMWAEEVEAVVEMQELLMEDNSFDDEESDSEPEELPMEDGDMSDDDDDWNSLDKGPVSGFVGQIPRPSLDSIITRNH